MNNIISAFNKPEFFIPFLIWSFFWKGWALWKSANKKQLIWFILILFMNTLGFLEIIYIFYLNRFDIDKGKTLDFLEQKFKRSQKK
ncbi:MAG: DUF5652 family protein [Patescibacteria group bacterium]